MSEQFEQINNQVVDTEIGKINPSDTEVPAPINLTEDEDGGLSDILRQAKLAERNGDSQSAANFYENYKIAYQKLRETKEIEYLESEDRKIDFVEKLIAAGGILPRAAVLGLTGLDSSRAWELREKMLSEDPENGRSFYAASIGGLDNEKAWEARENMIAEKWDHSAIEASLRGLDSEKAWEMRNSHTRAYGKLMSTLGCVSPEAWGVRNEFINHFGSGSISALESLAGIDDDQAWSLRNKFTKSAGLAVETDALLKELAGCSSEMAWAVRNKYLFSSQKAESLALSLTGIDDENAWAIRQRFLASGQQGTFIQSLAGVDSKKAWDDREKFLAEGMGSAILIKSLENNFLVGIQADQRRKISKITEEK